MPASNPFLRTSLKILTIILTLTLVQVPVHAQGSASQPTSPSLVSVNLLINYGNATLEWHNGTQVPADWNFFNVTVAVTNGNIGAVFFQSFGSHFVYMIKGVGCPTVFGCPNTWILWVLNGICWDTAEVGVDQIPVSSGKTVGWLFGSVSSFGQVPPTGKNCFSVNIDIKPEDSQNVVNVGSQGSIPVAILTTDQFNATTVDPSTVRFGRLGTEAAPLSWALEDVNGDGRLDLLLHFKTTETGIQPSDSIATLMGRTLDGTPFRGTDTIHSFLRGGGGSARGL